MCSLVLEQNSHVLFNSHQGWHEVWKVFSSLSFSCLKKHLVFQNSFWGQADTLSQRGAGDVSDKPSLYLCRNPPNPPAQQHQLKVFSLATIIFWLAFPFPLITSVISAQGSGSICAGIATNSHFHRNSSEDQVPGASLAPNWNASSCDWDGSNHTQIY